MIVKTPDRGSTVDLLFILFLRQHRGNFRNVGELDLEEPTGRERFAVYESRIVGDTLVDLDDLAAHGRIDVARSLDRFDDGARLARFHLATHVGKLDEDNVRKFVLRVVGDAHGGNVAGDSNPFVRLGIFKIGWNLAHKLWLRGYADCEDSQFDFSSSGRQDCSRKTYLMRFRVTNQAVEFSGTLPP